MLLEKEMVVSCPDGLHARPAAAVVKLANSYSGRITLYWKDKTIEGKSILGILSAGVRCGEVIKIAVDGDDAAAMLEQLAAVLTAGAAV